MTLVLRMDSINMELKNNIVYGLRVWDKLSEVSLYSTMWVRSAATDSLKVTRSLTIFTIFTPSLLYGKGNSGRFLSVEYSWFPSALWV